MEVSIYTLVSEMPAFAFRKAASNTTQSTRICTSMLETEAPGSAGAAACPNCSVQSRKVCVSLVKDVEPSVHSA